MFFKECIYMEFKVRSSPQEMYCKKSVLQNFANFIGNA